MTNKIFISSRRIALFIAILGGIWAWQVHSTNIEYLESTARMSGDRMVHTADDASYLAPAANFKRYGIWKDNTQGVSSYIQRPPGMGLINFSFYLFSRHGDMGMQKLVNILLHVLALYLFGLMAVELLGKKTAIFVQLIYALLPCFWGYLFYYITESITPSLLVFLFYGYVKQQAKPGSKWLIYQACICGILLLTRPQLGIFLLPFFYFLWNYIREKHFRKWTTLFFCFILAFGGFGLWQIRSVAIAKHWVGIHPIYDVTNNTQYRPVHRSFGELFQIWEHNSKKFHGAMTYLWLKSADPDTNASFDASELMLQIPTKALQYEGLKKFTELFNDYYLACKELNPIDIQHTPVSGETVKEKMLRQRVDSLTHVLKSKMWKENYIKTPLHSIQFMFSKSQLNLKIFQEKYRGFWWMEALRYACLIIIIVSTLLTLVHVFNSKNKPLFFFTISVILYFFYLFFIQKMNEERYLVPLLPLLFLMASISFKRLFDLFAKPND